jgi:hypothetical protein
MLQRLSQTTAEVKRKDLAASNQSLLTAHSLRRFRIDNNAIPAPLRLLQTRALACVVMRLGR